MSLADRRRGSDQASRAVRAGPEERRAIDQAAAQDEAKRETSAAVARLADAQHDPSLTRDDRLEEAAELQRTHARHEDEKTARR